jgi:transcriptional regulator with XRE-family HTH domain
MTASIVVRRSIGRRLKALRLAAGKTQADVVAVASPAKLKRMESGQVTQRMADVRTLCFMYGADDVTTEQLVELTLINSEAGWWEDYSDAVPSWFAMYIELEAAATRLFTYDPELVHGLLQTPDYHRALIAAESALVPDLDEEQQIELRIRRQRAAFERIPPVQVTSVLGTGAVDRKVGGPGTTSAQLAHLVNGPAEVRVLPASVGAHAAMNNGAFTLLEFATENDPSVVYLETLVGGRYVERPEQIAVYRKLADDISRLAVPIEEYLR